MIRRTVIFTSLVAASFGILGGTASADPLGAVPTTNANTSAYALCAWNIDPLNVGLCVGL